MKLVIIATCDCCKMELCRLQFEAGVNSAIYQIKTGEIDDHVKNFVCPKHPAADVICEILVGESPPDKWTKKLGRSKPPPTVDIITQLFEIHPN
ncbi:MAG: hypothetical protein A2Y07_06775 [Planctomycetes bacterium GWF2_50_10]|nr:MAG: hypothetical protein A2Y07_06775 [Planctomycetes bacterium GWF2_50_10]